MKYHKITGVDMDICTAEQIIAYNLAHSYGDCVSNTDMIFNVPVAAKWLLNLYSGKYDRDAIFCALNAGLAKYLSAGSPILTSYKSVGDYFPAEYMEGKIK